MNEKSKVKILIIGPDSPHVANFISRLDTEDFELQVISSGSKYISFTPNHIVDFSLKRIWNFLIVPKKIKHIAKAFNPDVVWMHQANSFSLYPVLGLKKQYPLILTVWGSDILVAPQNSKWIKKMTQYILSRVDAITADARYLGKKALELSPNPSTPLYICQIGINPIDVSEEKERVIYSNRGHKPLYRIPEVINAFYRFQQKGLSDWRLVIAGDGAETPNLKKSVKELSLQDKVLFVGFLSQEENAIWYGRSSLFISIPESDGTAVSLLEAMHYGCLPIVSNLPANREWITHGVNGYIATNLKDDFIEEALKVDREIARDKNQTLIQKLATPKASRQKFENVINEVLKNKK